MVSCPSNEVCEQKQEVVVEQEQQEEPQRRCSVPQPTRALSLANILGADEDFEEQQDCCWNLDEFHNQLHDIRSSLTSWSPDSATTFLSEDEQRYISSLDLEDDSAHDSFSPSAIPSIHRPATGLRALFGEELRA